MSTNKEILKLNNGKCAIIGCKNKSRKVYSKVGVCSKHSGSGFLDNIKSAFKGVDLHSLLLKINPFSTTGIPGELHFYIPGLMEQAASFMGPGTNLSERLNLDGTPKSWSEPINNVDAACYVHNVAYNSADKTSDPHYIHHLKLEADAKLLVDVSHIKPLDLVERAMKFVVQKIIGWKLKQGFGLDEPQVYRSLNIKVPKHLSKLDNIDWKSVSEKYGDFFCKGGEGINWNELVSKYGEL